MVTELDLVGKMVAPRTCIRHLSSSVGERMKLRANPDAAAAIATFRRDGAGAVGSVGGFVAWLAAGLDRCSSCSTAVPGGLLDGVFCVIGVDGDVSVLFVRGCG